MPSDEELEMCLKALKRSRAAGWDGVPAEAYQCSKVARFALFALVKRIWTEEVCPEELAKGVFVPLYKNKGSSDDMNKYRFLCLLLHAYKLLSSYLLFRLGREVECRLPDSQAGFRKDRGGRDHILILTWLIDQCVEANQSLVLTFVDFAAAFDSVSHRSLDAAMASCGASNKCRAVFRAIYSKASAVVRVRGSDGEDVFSSSFPIDRGVLQGDVLSPLCFIIVVLWLVEATPWVGGGVGLMGEWVRDLWYVDDGVFASEDAKTGSEMLTAFAEVAEVQADMTVAASKTEAMHIGKPAEVGAVTVQDLQQLTAQGVLKFVCSCGEPFAHKSSLEAHQRTFSKARLVYGWCVFDANAWE